MSTDSCLGNISAEVTIMWRGSKIPNNAGFQWKTYRWVPLACPDCLPSLILMSLINVRYPLGNDLYSKTGQWYQEQLFFSHPLNYTSNPMHSSVLSSLPHKPFISLHPACVYYHRAHPPLPPKLIVFMPGLGPGDPWFSPAEYSMLVWPWVVVLRVPVGNLTFTIIPWCSSLDQPHCLISESCPSPAGTPFSSLYRWRREPLKRIWRAFYLQNHKDHWESSLFSLGCLGI